MIVSARQFYDTSAELYDERHDNATARCMRSAERKLIRKHSKGAVLDIGCGTGAHLSNGIGLDVSKGMLDIARARGCNLLVQGDAENLPFAEDSFDTVLCMFSVLNFCDRRKAVAEMSRVLKKGGVAIVSVASRWREDTSLFDSIFHETEERNTTARIHGLRVKSPVIKITELIGAFESNNFSTVEIRGLFKSQRPYWGGRREFSAAEKAKLALDTFLPNRAARVCLGVFKKI